VQIAGAAMSWALAASLAKFLFIRHIDPLALAQLRSLFSFVILLGVALVARRAMFRTRLRDVLGLAVLGIAGIALSNYSYLAAINLTNVTTAILIQYTAPIWVMLYSIMAGSERVTRRRMIAVLLAFGGCVLAVGGYRVSGMHWNAAGVAWGFAAAFSFSFFNIWGGRMANRVETWTGLLWALGAASIFWAAVHSPARFIHEGYSARQWLLFFVYAMLATLLPFVLFYSGLRRLPATHAIVTSTLEPVFAITFAFLLVGERLTSLQMAGMAAVIAAIILCAKGR
jgi:drug/metabolite transporter (DMT)-like permease